MSYSILQQPLSNSIQPSNNNIFNVVQQTDYDSNLMKDYKFIADLYVNGNNEVTLKTFPEDTDKGVFNLQSIVSSFTSYDFILPESIFNQCLNSWVTLRLIYGEEYDNNGYSRNMPSASGNTFYAINSTVEGSHTNYIPGDSNKKFLTNATEIKTYTDFGNQYLYFWNNGCTVKIRTFDVNDQLIGVYSVANPYVANTGIQRVNIGYDALDYLQTFAGDYTTISGNTNILNASVKKWNVCLINGSAQYSVNVDVLFEDSCSRYKDPILLYWLNELGGFDSFLFNKLNVRSFTKETKSYTKQSGGFSGGVYAVNQYDHTAINYATNTQESITLNADFLTREEILLLKELFSSSVVYYKDSTGLKAGLINTSSYTITKREKQFKLTLELKPSIKHNSQLL